MEAIRKNALGLWVFAAVAGHYVLTAYGPAWRAQFDATYGSNEEVRCMGARLAEAAHADRGNAEGVLYWQSANALDCLMTRQKNAGALGAP